MDPFTLHLLWTFSIRQNDCQQTSLSHCKVTTHQDAKQIETYLAWLFLLPH